MFGQERTHKMIHGSREYKVHPIKIKWCTRKTVVLGVNVDVLACAPLQEINFSVSTLLADGADKREVSCKSVWNTLTCTHDSSLSASSLSARIAGTFRIGP